MGTTDRQQTTDRGTSTPVEASLRDGLIITVKAQTWHRDQNFYKNVVNDQLTEQLTKNLPQEYLKHCNAK